MTSVLEPTQGRPRAGAGRTVRLLEAARYTGMPVAWDAIVGHEHAKRELRVVAASLARRDLAERLGVPLVTGLVISGPSGSGKTLLARAFAGSIDRPVYVFSAADLTAKRIARIYEALADTPSVVVIDEIDLIAERRQGVRPPTVVALCVALDGIVPATGPVTIGLTAEGLGDFDASVIRAGRLTTHVELEDPDEDERRELWTRYLAPIPTTGELDIADAVDRSQGLNGADIAAIARAAAGLSLADGLQALDQPHLDEALERRGLVRKKPKDDQVVRRATAIHEVGHAVYAFAVLGGDALGEVVLSSTGRGQGHATVRKRWADRHALYEQHWRLAVGISLAGHLAEVVVGGQRAATFGSGKDLTKATETLLRAADGGLLPAWGLLATERVERGLRVWYQDGNGSQAMRAALWEVLRTELDAIAEEVLAVLRPQRAAILATADHLIATRRLVREDLVAALRAAGAIEATTTLDDRLAALVAATDGSTTHG